MNVDFFMQVNENAKLKSERENLLAQLRRERDQSK